MYKEGFLKLEEVTLARLNSARRRGLFQSPASFSEEILREPRKGISIFDPRHR
jgi:hypothetical protein